MNQTEKVKEIGIDQPGWWCVDNLDINLRNQITSSKRTTLRLRLVQCTNSTANNNSCASVDEIKNFLTVGTLQAATISQYFDQDEFE